MTYRFFAIPAFNPAFAEAELNQLLAASRVLNVERHFVADGEASFWAICVSLAPGPGTLPDGLKADQGSGRRIDYREVLNEADFAVFAELRSLRKTIADAEGVAQYAVFTNEQLANMVRGRVSTLEALGKIEGIGPARLERYAARFLALLQPALAAN
jgi:superfamily II DNA helicase RecQ